MHTQSKASVRTGQDVLATQRIQQVVQVVVLSIDFYTLSCGSFLASSLAFLLPSIMSETQSTSPRTPFSELANAFAFFPFLNEERFLADSICTWEEDAIGVEMAVDIPDFNFFDCCTDGIYVEYHCKHMVRNMAYNSFMKLGTFAHLAPTVWTRLEVTYLIGPCLPNIGIVYICHVGIQYASLFEKHQSWNWYYLLWINTSYNKRIRGSEDESKS